MPSISCPIPDGDEGTVLTDLTHEVGNAIVGVNMSILPDGSVIVAGGKDNGLRVRKYGPFGTLNNLFQNPANTLSAYQLGTAVQQNGQVIVVGRDRLPPYHVNVTRFSQGGFLDLSFGINGLASTYRKHIYYSNLFEQKDGKIVVFGCEDNYNDSIPSVVTRLNANGTLDSSFAVNGQFEMDILPGYEFLNAGLQQPDGKLIFAGMAELKFLMIRLNTDGSLDESFGDHGIYIETAVRSWADAIALQKDGKILLTGDSDYKAIVARYTADGRRDSTFADNGFHFYPESYEGVALVILPNGKIISALKVFSTNTKAVLAQLLPNGQRDSTFGTNGLYDTGYKLKSRTLERSGDLLLLGGQKEDDAIVMHRFILDLSVGVIDQKEPSDALLIYPNPLASEFTLGFGLAQSAAVNIRLFDMNGRLVQTFTENEPFAAGEHKANLRSSDNLAAGHYVLTLEVNGQKMTSVRVTKI